MSARDEREELAQVICAIDGPATIGGRELAQGILDAGYSKPRAITIASERAVLAAGTVAVDEQGNAWKRGTGSWVSTGGDTPALYDDVDITLTVLYTPKES